MDLVGIGDSGKSLKQKADCTGLGKNQLGGNQADSSAPGLEVCLAREATGEAVAPKDGRLEGPRRLVQSGLLHSKPPSLHAHYAPAPPSCLPPQPPTPTQPPLPAAPATGSCGPSFLRAIPVVKQQLWVCGEVSHVYLYTPAGGREERRRETLSLGDRNDILT